MLFNYKGITSELDFGQTSYSYIIEVIDIIYEYFKIDLKFPQFKIIIHPDYKKNINVFPETRKGLIMLSTPLCDNGKYDYYQQIIWQFSHELVHVCKGFLEDRIKWDYLPDDDEEILAGGISISLIKIFCPTYNYRKKYSKTNLKKCEEKAELLKDIIKKNYKGVRHITRLSKIYKMTHNRKK